MISLDHYIVEFVSNNILALNFALGGLKVVAKISKNNTDDAILSWITGVKDSAMSVTKRGGPTQVSARDPRDRPPEEEQ